MSGRLTTETGNEDDGLSDLSEDDFFLAGSSSNEAAADDEWTDKSTKYCVHILQLAMTGMAEYSSFRRGSYEVMFQATRECYCTQLDNIFRRKTGLIS
ncbi:hypothetical protein LINGRAHAP2_LOCUS7524 [Linum grandiflorum]